MSSEEFKRKLTAILSADVEGYSRLMGDDESATVKTLEIYKGVMFTLINQHRGRVVDSPGDNLLAEFGSVVDAVQCAVSVQKELQARNANLPENRRMRFRIGINLGDVIEEKERIYGDGVNIAARLEALADPGGICISKTVFDHVEGKLPLNYQFLGEQEVKNIAKPIGAYKVLMETRVIDEKETQETKALPLWRKKAVLSVGIILILAIILALYWGFYLRRPSVEAADPDKMAYPLPDKPSIAILPFTNMSGDPEQDYIGDGLSENIISALSISSKIFVIARNSTFTYKRKPVKVQQVAEDLGVQYVLEGSIQKSGERLRVTAQLIDALTGHHLWSEKYDRELKELFDLQDEITKKIVLSLRVALVEGEDYRVFSKGTENLEAFNNWIKGLELYEKLNKEDNEKAKAYFEAAIKLDPEYVGARNSLAGAHRTDVIMGWSDNPSLSNKRAFELVQKALEIDDQSPVAHMMLGHMYLDQGEHEKAITENKRAIKLNPNYAQAHGLLAMTMMYSGRFEEAIALTKKAFRLDPKLVPVFLITLCESYIFLGRYEEALKVIGQMEEHVKKGDFIMKFFPPLMYSLVYQELGREEEARAYMTEALKINPNLSLERQRRTRPFKNPAHLQRVQDACRKAGMPERPPLPLPDKPSIAVLPFVNMSGDPEQEYFSDGLTEEIISALSKVPNLFVIARNSTFTYKGKPVKVQQVSEELGVRYVLEGSVRKAGDRVRVTAQLIDATTGHHLWSERYDRELKDIFALQDEITMKIITAMQVKLTGLQLGRALAKSTDNLDAYLKFLQGFKHFKRSNPDDEVLARRYFMEAIALDPEFANPYSFIGHIHLNEVQQGRSKSPQKSIEQAFKLAQKVLALDESANGGHVLLGRIHLTKRQHEKAIASCERAVALAPNSVGSLLWLGIALSNAGRHQEAIPHFKRTIRLSPLDPSMGLNGLGNAYTRMERHEEAITALKKALHYQPDYFRAHLALAVCYVALGREEEAHAEAAEVLRLNPRFSVKKFEKTLPIRDKAVKERFIDALRKAGLPD